jgi:hypothetical protein
MFKFKHPASLFSLLIIILYINSCGFLSDSFDAITGATGMLTSKGNSPFHGSDEKRLKTGSLEVAGEVADPGPVDLTYHYKREIIVKDARPGGDMDVRFKGAYRYRGYSLFDLLHPFVVQKNNIEEFRPGTDIYIIIENETGKRVVFSWSEIFHTSVLHQVIIATEVAPIESYRQELEFETVDKWTVVSGADLFSHRMLENPVKIEIRSFNKKTYVVNRDMDKRHSPAINVIPGNNAAFTISNTAYTDHISYLTLFYGMGMGHHPTSSFYGPPLEFFIEDKLDLYDEHWSSRGLVCFAGIDGYRAIYSFSELFNRADQVRPILAISDDPDDGYYRIFHPSSFYADRSVKSLSEIYFFKE